VRTNLDDQQLAEREATLARHAQLMRERETALDDLAKTLGWALATQTEPAQERMIRRTREDLLTLGCSPHELNRAGIKPFE
jgi:hypothetical protein